MSGSARSRAEDCRLYSRGFASVYGEWDRRMKLRADNRPEAEFDALLLEEQKEETALFSKAPHARAVGAFEGANYEASGYYRSQQDCVMFSRNEVPFCAACQRGLSKVIDLYAAPPR